MNSFVAAIWNGYSAQLVSFGLSLFTAVIFWISRARPKILWGIQHGFSHSLPPTKNEDGSIVPPVLIHTTAILFTNWGRAVAANLEVTFNYRPNGLSVWPQRQFSVSDNPNGRTVVKFDGLSPRETLTINIVTIGTSTPSVLSVRCDQGSVREIPLIPARQFKKPTLLLLAMLLFLGVLASFYLLISVVAWFAKIGS